MRLLSFHAGEIQFVKQAIFPGKNEVLNRKNLSGKAPEPCSCKAAWSMLQWHYNAKTKNNSSEFPDCYKIHITGGI